MSTAKLLDDEDIDYEHAEHRLGEKEKEGCIKASRVCSLIVGFSIGIFIQFSSLALNFLVTNPHSGNEYIALRTYAIATCVWSIISSSLGVSVVLLMRYMVVTTFYSTNTTTEKELLEEKEEFMEIIIQNLEQFFSIGAVGGVATAWTATDLLLGIKGHLVATSLVFLISVMWYCVSPSKPIRIPISE